MDQFPSGPRAYRLTAWQVVAVVLIGHIALNWITFILVRMFGSPLVRVFVGFAVLMTLMVLVGRQVGILIRSGRCPWCEGARPELVAAPSFRIRLYRCPNCLTLAARWPLGAWRDAKALTGDPAYRPKLRRDPWDDGAVVAEDASQWYGTTGALLRNRKCREHPQASPTVDRP